MPQFAAAPSHLAGVIGVSNVPAARPGAASAAQVRRSADERLMYDLLRDYDRNVPPPLNPSTGSGVNVTVYMWPYDIMHVRWTDRNLRWKPEDYDGINETFIIRSEIWLPEVDIFYSKAEAIGMREICTHCPVRITHDGRILRGYYFSYSFPCKIDVSNFPFDKHFCHVELANWHMDERYMDLWPEAHTIDLTVFLANEEWELLNMTVKRLCDFYNYGMFPQLSYEMWIKRKPFFYILNQVIPGVLLTSAALVGYHMPSSGIGMHVEKVKMGMTAILSIFILQLGVADKLPRVADVVPLIMVFYGEMVIMLSLAILTSSTVILIEKQGIYDKPVPKWIRMLFMLDTGRTSKTHPALVPMHGCVGNCRIIDCGCNVRLQPHVYQYMRFAENGALKRRVAERHNSSKQSPIRRIDTAMATQNAMTSAVGKLRELFAAGRNEIETQKERIRIRAEWMRLADRVENISLMGFLSAVVITTTLFFRHNW